MSGTAILRVIIIPFGLMAAAFGALFLIGLLGLFAESGREGAQWVLAALWLLAPVAGGLVSRNLPDREINLGGTFLGLLVAAGMGYVLFTGAGTADSCQSGGPRDKSLFIAGLLATAAIAGAGAGGSTIVTARLARTRLALAVLVGGAVSFVASAGAYVLLFSIVICLHP